MFYWETLGDGIQVSAVGHRPPIQTVLWTKYTPSSQQHYLMAGAVRLYT